MKVVGQQVGRQLGRQVGRSIRHIAFTALWAITASGAIAASPSPVVAQGIDVIELTVEEIQEDYASGAYTAVELTQAFLERIAEYEDHYNAFVSMNPEALLTAATLDREYAVSGPRGPLHGVPVVIKDNFDYAGLVTTAGWEGFSSLTGGIDMIPDDDAATVERLKAAGAIILGKTNLPDFAGHGTRTISSVAGETLNASSIDRAPGGSSGGTATAVNGSFAVLGFGTETGGSIQNPAASQGLVGMKPTFGLVPLEGIYPIDASYKDVAGPIARTVRDAAIALDVIAGPSMEDLASYASVGHMPEGGYAAGLSTSALQGKRFGLVGLGWRETFLPLAPETEDLYQTAIADLEAQGAEVVKDPFLNSGFIDLYGSRERVPTQGSHDVLVYLQGLGPGAAFNTVEEWEALAGRPFGRQRPGNEGRQRERQPPTRPSATEEGDAFQAWRVQIRALFRQVMEDNDLDGLFFPQSGAPIRDRIEDPDRPDFNPNNHAELPSNIINDIGLPVVTVPHAHYEDGMPFVLAFIGDLWTDGDLLSYAYDLERATRSRVAPTLNQDARH